MIKMGHRENLKNLLNILINDHYKNKEGEIIYIGELCWSKLNSGFYYRILEVENNQVVLYESIQKKSLERFMLHPSTGEGFRKFSPGTNPELNRR